MSADAQRSGSDSPSTKYDVGDSMASMDVPMTDHALDRYHSRLPDDAVRPPVAWRRGEDIQHPSVVATLHADRDPSRVRVYNHDDDYFAIFVCVDSKFGAAEEIVVSVYALRTHEHGPTRCYLAAHGPHYQEQEVDRDE